MNIKDAPRDELEKVLANPAAPNVAKVAVLKEIARRAPKPTFMPKGLPFATDEAI